MLIPNTHDFLLRCFPAHPRGNEPVRAWNGHRAREHRLQLRHARGYGHIPSSCRQSRSVRHKGEEKQQHQRREQKIDIFVDVKYPMVDRETRAS